MVRMESRKKEADERQEIGEWARQLKESGKLVIVEGRKDRESLESFGIRNMITLDGPLYAVVEKAAGFGQDAVILTDLDAEGRKLYGVLSRDLAAHGVRVDDSFREFLQKNTKLRQIEGLKRYFGRLR